MKTIIVKEQRERAFMVGVEEKTSRPLLNVEESLKELALLAGTAGLEIAGQIYQRVDRIDPATLIGSGKMEEVLMLVEELEADIVIFDEELSPRHQREIEKIFGDNVRLLDRTALILDIFAQHARTREGQLQVELAQLEYRLPRLTRMWTHLARQAGGQAGGSGGGVGLRGPGETQLEVDRRMINQRITHLKTELEKVRAHRSRYRSQRQKRQVPVVAIVGYTNAGKSTLLNQLSGANILAADKLFATLDPTTRRVELPSGLYALYTDTVGFIQKLPTMLVASFRATLEEISGADILLHVVDATHPQALEQAESVIDTLAEIEADRIPIITALNKTDRIKDDRQLAALSASYSPSYSISALTGDGLESLQNAIDHMLYSNWSVIDVVIPYQDGALSALFHDEGIVEKETHSEEGVHMAGRIPTRLAHRFQPYLEEAS